MHMTHFFLKYIKTVGHLKWFQVSFYYMLSQYVHTTKSTKHTLCTELESLNTHCHTLL